MKKKVVLMGGGQGLSNIVKGFKGLENIDLSIVVTSADDGGHSGTIRDEFNTVGLGDLRMVIDALLDDKSSLKDIMNYRFKKLHNVQKVSLGNIYLLSLYEKFKDYDKVIKYLKSKENIKANVYLSSNTPLTLCAKYESGKLAMGECVIPNDEEKVQELFYIETPTCNPSMLKAIEKADIIVLGPGSLYTSVGAVLALNQIKAAIKKSNAKIVYVCNIMTQVGETSNYYVSDHETTLNEMLPRNIDRIIVNTGEVDEKYLDLYKLNKYGWGRVRCEFKKDNYEFYDLVKYEDNQVLHDSKKTANIIKGHL